MFLIINDVYLFLFRTHVNYITLLLLEEAREGGFVRNLPFLLVLLVLLVLWLACVAEKAPDYPPHPSRSRLR